MSTKGKMADLEAMERVKAVYKGCGGVGVRESIIGTEIPFWLRSRVASDHQ